MSLDGSAYVGGSLLGLPGVVRLLIVGDAVGPSSAEMSHGVGRRSNVQCCHFYRLSISTPAAPSFELVDARLDLPPRPTFSL